MNKPTLSIASLKPNAPVAVSADLQLLLTVSCPPADPSLSKARPRLNIGLSIDHSSSMEGKPLQEAKASAKRVIGALVEGDVASIVMYDDLVDVLCPATPVTPESRKVMLRAIDGITHRGMTNLHAGWLAAAEAAAPRLAPDVLTRVLLLSDGATNKGIKDIREIASQASALAARGISTSTIGLGRNFAEDLMTALAEAGQGNASYGETADDLWPSFESELGLMSATCGKNVRLRLRSPCGGRITVQDGFRMEGGEWLLPNLAHGAEISLVVTVAVAGLAGDHADVIEAEVCYEQMDGVAAEKMALSMMLPLVSFADFVIGLPNPVVVERVKELEAADLQLQAKAAANRMDFVAVRGIADKLTSISDGNAWISGIADTMRGLAEQGDDVMISKEASYASTSLRTQYKSSTGASGADLQGFLSQRTRQGIKG